MNKILEKIETDKEVLSTMPILINIFNRYKNYRKNIRM